MADYSAEQVFITINGEPASGLKGEMQLPDYNNDLIAHVSGTDGVAVRVVASDRSSSAAISILLHTEFYKFCFQLADKQSKGETGDVPMEFSIPSAGYKSSGLGSFKKPPGPPLPGFGEASVDAPVGVFEISMPSREDSHTGPTSP